MLLRQGVGLPTYLKSNVRLKFKIVDALALIKKIDVELSCVSLNLLIKLISAAVDDAMREVLLSVIDKNNLNFYQLSGRFAEIGASLADTLNAKLSAHGLVAVEANVVNISVPAEMRKKLEDQYFALAEMERVKQRENKWEEESLKLYEAKAAIHKKYPEYPVTLTEAEKDRALDRHLKRMDSKFNAYVADIWKNGSARDDDDEINEVLPPKPIPPIKPTEPQGNGKWRTLFIIAAVAVALAGGLVAGLVNLTIGLIILGVGAVGCITLGILKRDMLKNGVSEAEMVVYREKMSQYDDDERTYKVALAEYNRIDSALKAKAAAKKKAEEEARKKELQAQEQPKAAAAVAQQDSSNDE